MAKFKLVSKYQPTGDQPSAIKQLVDGINRNVHEQTLLGVTGSGKTFTMANIIEKTQRPTLVLAHNKTLAAQLYSEFREFFPENEVHYFVSYFDYYQPEAYIASTDTYIEKDSAINDEIDRLRHGATEALLTRRDCIVIASVSCIYGIGSPDHYTEMSLPMWRTGLGFESGSSRGRVASDRRHGRSALTLGRNLRKPLEPLDFKSQIDTTRIHPPSSGNAIPPQRFGI